MRTISPTHFRQLCHEHGLKATAQRYEIYSALIYSKKHPTAEGIFEKVSAKLSGLTLDTVYRTLTGLTRAGLAIKIPLPGGATHFDGTLEQHQHFMCEICNNIYDFNWPEFEAMKCDLTGLGTIKQLSLVAFGICQHCQETSGSMQ